MPVSRRRTAAIADLRYGVPLVGAIDGINVVFTTPEAFVRLSLYGLTICVLYNGQRLVEGAAADFTVSESGGLGSGFDTVSLSFAPLVGDVLLADYIAE